MCDNEVTMKTVSLPSISRWCQNRTGGSPYLFPVTTLHIIVSIVHTMHTKKGVCNHVTIIEIQELCQSRTHMAQNGYTLIIAIIIIFVL